MKILGGTLGGRSFSQPSSATVRPLSDKVRAALFDVYGDVSGQSVLDAYAGSGAAGFEAASRGAAMVEAIEANVKVVGVITDNARMLGLDWGYQLRHMTVSTWLARAPDALPQYDLVIADPPYASLEPDIIERLAACLGPEGVLVLSHSSKRPSPALDGAEIIKQKVYGDTALTFYRRG